jgi:hypothetical protein
MASGVKNRRAFGGWESKIKVRLGIRSKILIFFLALSFISLGVISSLAFRTIYQVSFLVKQNSTSMAEEVARQSISALEDLGRTLIQRRALYVADEIRLFIQYHPYLGISAPHLSMIIPAPSISMWTPSCSALTCLKWVVNQYPLPLL